ncbi:hypothetical protein YC2023_012843 [Brassica napus]
MSRLRPLRNCSAIFVSCSRISGTLRASSRAHMLAMGLKTEKAKTVLVRRRRDSREMGYHAHWLDLTVLLSLTLSFVTFLLDSNLWQSRNLVPTVGQFSRRNTSRLSTNSGGGGVDYAVEIELPEDGETPETVRPGYCGVYMSHFEDGGLSFLLPCFLLEALAKLKMAFTQMARKFCRYFLAFWVRAQEEGLVFGLKELNQLFAIKRNNGFPGTMILAPRSGRVIIEGIPNKDDRWREKFFVFKVNLALVGDFDFKRIPREWSANIEPFGHAPMTPELRGLMATLRRGSPRWLAFTHDRIRTAYALSPGVNRATHVTLVAPVRPKKGRCNKRKKEKEVLLDRPDESSEVGVPEASSWAFSYDNEIPILENPDSLTAIWRKIRAEGCELPSLERMRERDACVRMAVVNTKAMEASNEYAALMEGRLANFPKCVVCSNSSSSFSYSLFRDISSRFEPMAIEKFGPHLRTILEAKHIEAIYELWGVDYAIEIELPEDGETRRDS